MAKHFLMHWEKLTARRWVMVKPKVRRSLKRFLKHLATHWDSGWLKVTPKEMQKHCLRNNQP